jgi:hypothetical protein
MRERLTHLTRVQLAVLGGIAAVGMSGGAAASYEAGWWGGVDDRPPVAATADASAVASATVSSSAAATANEVLLSRRGYGPANHVSIQNHEDYRLRTRGSFDYAGIEGERVRPDNYAHAQSTCTDCQTIAVAAQVVLYERGANEIVPRNQAVAINIRCLRCVTIAVAYQYLIPVDDLDDAPGDTRQLVRDLDREFSEIERIKSLRDVPPIEVESRINSVIVRFHELALYLQTARDEHRSEGDDRGQTPTPTAASDTPPVATMTPTPPPTATPVASEAAP